MRVCKIIWGIDDSDMLQTLLAQSKTLRAPQGKEFPIARARSVIFEGLAELHVATSQT